MMNQKSMIPASVLAATLTFSCGVLAAPGGGRGGGQQRMQSYGTQGTSGGSGSQSGVGQRGGTGNCPSRAQGTAETGASGGLGNLGSTGRGTSGGLGNLGAMGAGSSQGGGGVQLTVAPVSNSGELNTLVAAVERAAAGAGYQVRLSGDGQTAVVSVNSAGTSNGSALAQVVQSAGFRVTAVSSQGSGASAQGGQGYANRYNSGALRSQTQQTTGTVVRSYSTNGLQSGNRVQYGSAAATAMRFSTQQARVQQQYQAIQSMYRRY
jgi:hypothetical protein